MSTPAETWCWAVKELAIARANLEHAMTSLDIAARINTALNPEDRPDDRAYALAVAQRDHAMAELNRAAVNESTARKTMHDAAGYYLPPRRGRPPTTNQAGATP